MAQTQGGQAGLLLRHWRDTRHRSQLDLSLETGVSQRHISCIESGKSAAGRQTLLILARALDIPLRVQNDLLLAAGFAPVHPEDNLDAAAMDAVSQALRRMLRQQEPFPAIVMDRHWNVVLTNDAAPKFFGHFVDLASHPTPRNLLEMVFDPAGLRPFLANWPDVAISLLDRVARETVGHVADDGTRALLARLNAFPGVRPEWQVPAALPAHPAVPMIFEYGGQRFSLFSLVTTIGTPRTVTAQELRLECLFPADADSERSYVAAFG